MDMFGVDARLPTQVTVQHMNASEIAVPASLVHKVVDYLQHPVNHSGSIYFAVSAGMSKFYLIVEP